jgi:hypothetical protein
MVKRTIFDVLYEEGDLNLVIDTKVEGVSVPDSLYGKLTNFIVGHTPTPNLGVDESGITAPMRFGGNRFVCYFPWPALRAMISKKAVVNFPVEGEEEHEEKTEKSTSPLKLIK